MSVVFYAYGVGSIGHKSLSKLKSNILYVKGIGTEFDRENHRLKHESSDP